MALPAVTIAASTPTLPESSTTTGIFTVSREAGSPTQAALVVEYVVGGTADSGADYQQLSGSVTIPVGQLTANVALTVLPDTTFDPDETVTLTIVSSSAAYTGGTPATAAITLIDTPPVASNLKLKLQADRGTTVDTNGKLSTWQDQSVGNNATQASAATSTGRNNVVNSLSGAIYWHQRSCSNLLNG